MEALKNNNKFIFLIVILNFITLKAQIFKEFTNIDSVHCSNFSYSFHYYLEKDTLINGFIANKFTIGENSNKTNYFWIGKKNNSLYSLQIDKKGKYKRANYIDLESKNPKIDLYVGAKGKIRLEKKSAIKVKSPDYYIYEYDVINYKSLKKNFSNHYQLNNLILDPKEGVLFDFDYSDDDHTTVWGKCYKL
ncbi:MAG: hypothetical protein WDA08_08460 [Weeksellaceae bacterium]